MFAFKSDLKSFMKNYPVTVAIVTICFLITIVITILGGYTKSNLVLLGAYDKSLINNGELWRLLTYSFNHMSYPHFILNIVFLIYLSHPLERALGRIKFILSFIFTTIFAGIIIHLFSNVDYIAGSSGFGYGLLGMYIFLFLKYGSTPKSVLDLKKHTKKHLYPLLLRVRPNNRTRYTYAFPFYQGFTRFTRVKYTYDSKRTKSGAY